MKAKSVVLAHGAWADGSSWSKVIPRLTAEGLNVTAIQMPLTSFEDDVACIGRAIALAEGPVVLVGHSYGGSVITEAGGDEKVSALVYVAAFAPDVDESAASLGETVEAPPMAAEVRPDSAGFLKLTEAGIRKHFAGDLTELEKTILYAAQAPTAVGSLTGKITEPAWQTKPSWYLLATEDHAIAPKLQKIMADRMLAKVTKVASSHVAMLSHPDAAARLILEAANG